MVVSPSQAKLGSMLAIGLGSFIVGVAPACFVSRVRDLQQRLLLSCTLCFGGGVLLSTAVLHMLPETREDLPDHAELVFACGFLMLYLIDETVHYVWGSRDEHTPDRHRHSLDARSRSSTAGEHGRGLGHQVGSVPSATVEAARYQVLTPAQPSWRTPGYGAVQHTTHTLPSAPAPCCNERATFLCHGNHDEPCADSNIGLAGLLLALTVHAVLEGLAVGLQQSTSEVLLLVGAVASHKFVVGFCLGVEMAGAGSSIGKLILAIFVFSGGSALGIGIGMLTLGTDKKWSTASLPVLQGLAGGTLLYVTVSEVLPRERARWHRSSRRCAGVLQFFSTTLGFLVVYLLNNYVGT